MVRDQGSRWLGYATTFKETFSASVMSSSLRNLYRDILATQGGGKGHAA